jgi:hypothetical protein
MTIHIFSIYGYIIKHPLQALILFLQYYSSLQWGSVIISLSNISAITDATITPTTKQQQSVQSLNHEALNKMNEIKLKYKEKYEHVVTIHSDNIKSKMTSTDRHSEDLGFTMSCTDDFIEDCGGNNNRLSEHAITKHCMDRDMSPLSSTNIHGNQINNNNQKKKFQISYVNIKHPIKSDVNMTYDITETESEELKIVFERGYKIFNDVIMKCNKIALEKNGKIDLGMNISLDIGGYFMACCLPKTLEAGMQSHMKSKLNLNYSLRSSQLSRQLCTYDQILHAIRHADFVFGYKVQSMRYIQLLIKILLCLLTCMLLTICYRLKQRLLLN